MRPFRSPLTLLAALLFSVMLCMPTAAHAQFDKDYNETIRGAKIHFRVRGLDKANPYLLILHGGPGFSAHMFYPWGATSMLEAWFNVVYLDQRGSGQSERLKIADLTSPKPEEVKDYTMATLIDDIEAVRKRLKVPKWYVLGQSWGGMLGLEYVTAHPEAVTGYIHMDGLVSQPQAQDSILAFAREYYDKRLQAATDDKEKQAAQKTLDTIAKLQAMPPGDRRLQGVFGLIFADQDLFQAVYYVDKAKSTAYQEAIAEVLKLYKLPTSIMIAPEPLIALLITEHYATRDDTPLLEKVSVPTLVLNGREDHLITAAQAEAVHAKIKGSTILILEDCGHFPFVEQPDSKELKGAILAFVSSCQKEQ